MSGNGQLDKEAGVFIVAIRVILPSASKSKITRLGKKNGKALLIDE
jgi:hypothetical protein